MAVGHDVPVTLQPIDIGSAPGQNQSGGIPQLFRRAEQPLVHLPQRLLRSRGGEPTVIGKAVVTPLMRKQVGSGKWFRS